DVALGAGEQAVDVGRLELADHLPGRAHDDTAVGNLLAFGDQRARPDQATAADLRAVEHDGLDADPRAVADGAPVQHRLVADRHEFADGGRAVGIDVQHGAFWDV